TLCLSRSYVALISFLSFFFQAEDGIRDRNVTGVQTCALPIYIFHCILLKNLYIIEKSFLIIRKLFYNIFIPFQQAKQLLHLLLLPLLNLEALILVLLELQ